MSKKITTIRADESLFNDLKIEAANQERSFNNLITCVLVEYINGVKAMGNFNTKITGKKVAEEIERLKSLGLL